MLLRLYLGLESLFESFLLSPRLTLILLILLYDPIIILSAALQMFSQLLAHIFRQALKKILTE